MKLRATHYWRREIRKRRPERFAAVACDAAGTIARLSAEPQKRLSWFGRFIAVLTTPFKFSGISGWKETGCGAEASGRPVRDAQHSTDGFWTVDVRLESFRIGTALPDPGETRFIRVEIEPGTKAHEVCTAIRVLEDMRLAFGGAVVLDTDGPFLEVHPEDDFQIIS